MAVSFEMFCTSCGVACIEDANFCHECGNPLDSNIRAENNTDNIIEGYFYRGYPYSDIVDLLKKRHGVSLHLHTLKRKLKDLGLKRRGEQFQEEVVRQAIEKEMREAGSLAGYQSIWHALRLRHRLIVPRHVVSMYMKDINPVGVRERRSRRLRRRAYVSYGPNFVWHIDGNYTTGCLKKRNTFGTHVDLRNPDPCTHYSRS